MRPTFPFAGRLESQVQRRDSRPKFQQSTHQRRILRLFDPSSIDVLVLPTGYEMILRASVAKGVDFESFQDDFDLDITLGGAQSQPRNHFGSIADEIRKKYPWVEFGWKQFSSGEEKIRFIDEQLLKQQPVLISLAQEPFGGRGWHIMPVVDATEDQYLLLEYVESNGKLRTNWINKGKMADIHDQYDGGCEVAFLLDLGEPDDQRKKE